MGKPKTSAKGCLDIGIFHDKRLVVIVLLARCKCQPEKPYDGGFASTSGEKREIHVQHPDALVILVQFASGAPALRGTVPSAFGSGPGRFSALATPTLLQCLHPDHVCSQSTESRTLVFMGEVYRRRGMTQGGAV